MGREISDSDKTADPLPASSNPRNESLKCPSKEWNSSIWQRSYSVNCGTSWYNQRGIGNSYGYSARMSEVSKPSNTMLMGERLASHQKLGGFAAASLISPTPGRSGLGVHGDSLQHVYVMCDGHVEFLNLTEIQGKLLKKQ